MSCLFALSACTETKPPEVCGEGCRYKQALIEAIDSSDRIVVSEQSTGSELRTKESDQAAEPVVYGRKKMGWIARQQFKRSVREISDQDQQTFALCVAEYHHKIEFYSKGKVQSTLLICFHCGQSYWDAHRLLPPQELFKALTPVIERAGFRTERDWVALAAAAQKK
ncbi:MAG TPA: hypothetical protein VK629_17095 [Steroidobacteraceae bacterium]|nr:hypothetical protein [Steroidobacteraceae bacterium]